MKGKAATLGLAAAIWLLIPVASFGQEAINSVDPGAVSIGLQVGGNQVFGDFNNNDIAPGFEAVGAYFLRSNLSLHLGLGYNRTKGGPDAPPRSFTYGVNVIMASLFGQYRVLPDAAISPYIRAGVGEYNFDSGAGRFFDTAVLGGAGIEFWATPELAIYLGADYYHTLTSPGDGLDGVTAGGRDGMLQGRAGVQFLIHRPAEAPPTILATEPVPIIETNQREGEQLEGFLQRIRSMEKKDQGDDMQQYLKLRSRIDELQQRIDSREKEIESLMQSVEEKKREIETLESQVERKPAMRTSAAVPSASTTRTTPRIEADFSKAYEQGLNRFYMKRYGEAIDIFQSLLQTYPNHSLASNCEYWLAESYFGAGEPESAERHFWRVLDYPRSLKKDDALFSLSKLYLARKDSARARQVLERLIADFPDSEYATQAAQQLARL